VEPLRNPVSTRANLIGPPAVERFVRCAIFARSAGPVYLGVGMFDTVCWMFLISCVSTSPALFNYLFKNKIYAAKWTATNLTYLWLTDAVSDRR